MTVEPVVGFVRRSVKHPTGGESKTKQSDALTTDIERIVERWLVQGAPPPSSPLRYGDFSNIGDYQECVLRVQQAQEQFMDLPAKVRKVCGNDPGRFLEMCEDPEGMKLLEEAGLATDRKPSKELEAAAEPAAGGVEPPEMPENPA